MLTYIEISIFKRAVIQLNSLSTLVNKNMPKQIEEIPLVVFMINFSSKVPIYKQLYDSIRNSILEGKFTVGQKLPGTRALAAGLKISRYTVATAFQQLLNEGYIKGIPGSGSYVNEIPDKLLLAKTDKLTSKTEKKIVTKIYKQIESIQYYHEAIAPKEIVPFQTNALFLEDFPIKTWLKLNNRATQIYSGSHLRYSDATGYKPLKEEIAKYLRTYRAVNCNADQIIIVTGSQQGLDLIAKSLLEPGDSVVLEDPGYFGIKMALKFTHAKICPAPLDSDGIDIEYIFKNYLKPKLIYTTPSHQYPTGAVMRASRRRELLQYANENDCLIIEDDYDSEFRYAGSPLPSLQGIDKNNSVIYLGTFSKVLFPGLRLGYLVVTDPGLYEILATAKLMTDIQNPVFEQIITYLFLKGGHFTKHIRKMRVLYKKRQDFLINEIKKELKGLINIKESPAGMHIICWLPKNADDKKIAHIAKENDVIVFPLSNSSVKFFKEPALFLGYTAFNQEEIKTGIKKLKKILLENLN